MQKLESYKITSYLCSIKSNKIIHKQKTTHNDQRGNYGACSCIIIGSERRYITVLYNELYWRKQRKVRDCRTSPKVHSQTICHVHRCVIGRNERRKRIVNKFLIYKQKITAMHNNEFVIDERYEVDDHKEHYGSTQFQEFDGTEREAYGDRCEVFNLEDFCDTADRDRYENEMAQYDAVLETMDTDLAECSSEAEELATVSRLTKYFLELGYFAYIVNEAAADATIYHHQQKNTPN